MMIPTLPDEGAPRAVVTGTGRCGTGYMRSLLVACGVDAGHEDWFVPDGIPDRDRVLGRDVDVSWLALPFIENGSWRGPFVHLIREPIACIRSLVGTQHLTHPTSPWTAFAHSAMPSLKDLEDSPAVQAAEFWVEWNVRIVACCPDLTLKVEDVVHRLPELSEALGVDLNKDHVKEAGFDYLPEEFIWDMLDGRAEPFGYRPGR